MPRVKGGYTTRRRRKAILKLAKGYFGSKRTLYKTANEQVMRSLAYSYRDRKQRKRAFRKLWITRINAACRANEFKYSLLINGLCKANVNVNRKMLAELAIFDAAGFKDIIALAKLGLEGKTIPAAVADAPKEAPKKAAKATVKEVKEEAKVEVKEEVKAEETNLEALKVPELRELAKAKGIEGYSSMKKAELIEALKK